MNKIIGFFLLFIILNITTYPQNFWEKIYSPTSKKLNSIVFTDSLNGWVSGDSGLIIHTANGGKDWETQFSNDSLNVVNIFFLNDQIGWGSAWSSFYEPYGTFILTTTNGGMNWNSKHLRIGEAFVNSFYFLDTLTGFAVGYPNVFYRTTDGGSNWVDVNLDSSIVSGFPPYTIKFYSPQYGYACGGVRDIVGIVWRTTDGGENWETVVDALISEPLYDMQMFDSLNIIAMGGDPEFGASQVVTTDGGNTWEYKSLGVFWYPEDIGFRTSTEGWAPMGVQRKFLYSSNSGKDWTAFDTPDSTVITYICFPDSLHGFGIGNDGEIVKYVYQKPSFVQSEPDKVSTYFLDQNYPNPFNPNTKIEYKLLQASDVKLNVINILGEKVFEQNFGYQTAGSYKVNFDGKNLPSGVYVYSIYTDENRLSRKMLLMK
jgi:photosystem II stability/assembly factor-like uncharacterized protein